MNLCGLFLQLSLAVLYAASPSAQVHAQRTCAGPFNTLKSDCHGITPDQLCIEYDLRDGGASPCDGRKSTSVVDKRNCQRSAGATCDIIAYNARGSKTTVQFELTFSTSDTGGGGTGFIGGGGFIGDGGSGDDAGSGDETDASQSSASQSRESSSGADGDEIDARDLAEGDEANVGEEEPTEGVDASDVEVGDDDADPPRENVGPPPILVGNGGAFETDALVNAIGELKLPSDVTTVNLIGGRAQLGTPGRVASVDLDPNMLRGSPHVTSLYLQHLDVGEQLVRGDVIGGFPRGLEELLLSNVMLTTVPPKLASLVNLKTLHIAQNHLLTTFPRDIVLPSVTTLMLLENGLTSFDAVLPAMEELQLDGNQFTAIPDAVFENPKLRVVALSGNPIALPIVLTKRQVEILEGLTTLTIDHMNDMTQPVLYPVDASNRPMMPINNPTNGSANTGPGNSNATTGSSPFVVARPIGTKKVVHGAPVWEVTEDESKQYNAQQEAIAVASGATHATRKTNAGASKPADKATEGTRTSPHGGDTTTEAASVNPHDGQQGSVSGPGGSTTNTAASSNRIGGASGVSIDANTANKQNNKSHRTMLWTGAIGGVTVASIMVIIIFVVRRRQSRQSAKRPSTPRTPMTLQSPSSTDFMAMEGTQSGMKTTSAISSSSSSPQSLTIEDRNIRDLFSARRLRQIDIEDVRPIDATPNSIVWLVRHRGSRLLASKRLVQTNATQERVAAFMNEIVVVSELDHPSITTLVGVAWSSETDLQALFEYMPNGDLDSHLQSMDASAWPWDLAKLRLAIDIVEALVYAHSFSPPLLHRDLRTRHVLLSEENKPKLSGFGSARYASENNTMTTSGVGSARWLAPEILAGSADYDSASDMYAFGVMLSEMDTHAAPYDSGDDSLMESSIVERVTAGNLRPTLTAQCPAAIRDLASRCWSQDHRARPSAMQVAYELRQLLRQWESNVE